MTSFATVHFDDGPITFKNGTLKRISTALPHALTRHYYEERTRQVDPILEYSDQALKPVDANVKLVTDPQEGLLAKVLMIRNAKHTIDLSTYILTKDESGYIILNELKKAIERGVSVRILIDSAGSLDTDHCELKVLKQVSKGMQLNRYGSKTSEPATVEIRMFNPVYYPSADSQNLFRKVGNWFTENDAPTFKGWVNRRMHDKMLITDAEYGRKARVLLGGRNISNHYYGVPEVTSDTYNDMEIFASPTWDDSDSFASPLMSSIDEHYNRMFYHLGNKELSAPLGPTNWYCKGELETAEKSARYVLTPIRPVGKKLLHMQDENYLSSNMSKMKVNFLNEIQNLSRRNAFTNPEASTNPKNRPNGASVLDNVRELIKNAKESIEIVSPYLYLYPEEMTLLKNWLLADPKRKLTIISNSLYSADNVAAQALTDRETGPLFQATFNTPDLKERAKFLAFGKTDGTLFGGDKFYGKLHAKYLVVDGEHSLVTSSNGDPRSRYLNSEVGLLVHGKEIAAPLQKEIKALIDSSVEWGSAQWQAVRRHPSLKTKLFLQKNAYPAIKQFKLHPLI